MKSDSCQPVQKARLFSLSATGTNLRRPGFVAMYCLVLFFFCCFVTGEIVASLGEPGVFGWLFLIALCTIPAAWLSLRLRECYTLERHQPPAQQGVGINVDSISERLRRIRTDYLLPLATRHRGSGHSPLRLASARSSVRSRSFFAPQPFQTHEETTEHEFEI